MILLRHLWTEAHVFLPMIFSDCRRNKDSATHTSIVLIWGRLTALLISCCCWQLGWRASQTGLAEAAVTVSWTSFDVDNTLNLTELITTREDSIRPDLDFHHVPNGFYGHLHFDQQRLSIHSVVTVVCVFTVSLCLLSADILTHKLDFWLLQAVHEGWSSYSYWSSS